MDQSAVFYEIKGPICSLLRNKWTNQHSSKKWMDQSAVLYKTNGPISSLLGFGFLITLFQWACQGNAWLALIDCKISAMQSVMPIICRKRGFGKAYTKVGKDLLNPHLGRHKSWKFIENTLMGVPNFNFFHLLPSKVDYSSDIFVDPI